MSGSDWPDLEPGPRPHLQHSRLPQLLVRGKAVQRTARAGRPGQVARREHAQDVQKQGVAQAGQRTHACRRGQAQGPEQHRQPCVCGGRTVT